MNNEKTAISEEIKDDERMYFIIEDIKHTGNHGPKGESKVGFKYDCRRGHKIFLYKPLQQYYEEKGSSILLMDGEVEGNHRYIITTAFVEIRELGDLVELETINSVYILRRVE